MKKIRLLQDVPYSPNGLDVVAWNKNDVKEVDEDIFKSFIEEGLAMAFEPEIIVEKTVAQVKETEEKPKRKPGRPPKSEKESPKNKMFGFSPKDK